MDKVYRWGIAVLAALMVTFAQPATSFAQRDQEYRREVGGDFRMRVDAGGRDGELIYTLHLSPISENSSFTADAEMTVERRGSVRDRGRAGDDYGSILTVYLRDHDRVIHRGTWSLSDDRVTITLTDIDGRKDRAVFTGTVENGGRRLSLRVNNTGMYGRNVSFRLNRESRWGRGGGRNDNDDVRSEDVEGTYRTFEERRVDGRNIRIEYTLRLRSGGEAEMEIRTDDDPRNDSETSRVFGSMATVYLQGRRSVTHTGTWSVSGRTVTITLSRIEGRRDNATFTGTVHPDDLDLRCNNRGMYGDIAFRMDRR